MSETGKTGGGSALAALFVSVGLLIAFAIFFNLFLIVPFFIFIGGLIAMVVSDRRKSRDEATNAPRESES
ncbi:MAG: hypothetical protein M9938_02485 [Solirubrobacterales bacterium]|nr:hypothetical protein [Solirubrobacterales bacterium]